MAKEKLDVYKMAEELGLNKENVEFGMKKDAKGIEEMVKKAFDFKKKRGK